MNKKKSMVSLHKNWRAKIFREFSLFRFFLVTVTLAGLTIYFHFGMDKYLTFDALSEHHKSLSDWTSENRLFAITLFVIVYAIVVACSLPGAVWMTLGGGLIFGTVIATVAVVISASLGAVAVFLIARYTFVDFFRAKMGPLGKQIERGFREDALSYLLFLRLVPVFPFWLVNIVPAVLGVPLKLYILGTLVGIIPGSAVYCSVGSGLGAILEKDGELDIGIIFQPYILGPLIGLGVLSLLPIIYKRVNSTR